MASTRSASAEPKRSTARQKPTRSATTTETDPAALQDDWRSMDDRAERRKVQNRINQRAFRERMRSGEKPKPYSGRRPSRSIRTESGSASPLSAAEPSPSLAGLERADSSMLDPLLAAEYNAKPSLLPANTASEYAWDDLAPLLNRSFKAAAATNIAFLGLLPAVLEVDTLVLTPQQPSLAHIPPSLWPVPAQHTQPHDPFIDAIPHAQLRANILSALEHGTLDASTLSRDLRHSGALRPASTANEHAPWHRVGLLAWGAPAEPATWEVCEGFWRRWSFLLHGCDDLMAVTNIWRGQRHEAPLMLGEAGV